MRFLVQMDFYEPNRPFLIRFTTYYLSIILVFIYDKEKKDDYLQFCTVPFSVLKQFLENYFVLVFSSFSSSKALQCKHLHWQRMVQ